jgi:RNA polymerase sigma-70 factor, ECF subfamily
MDEDREAIRRVQAGETEAFEVLVEKYKRKAFRLAFQVLRDQEEALDVAQEAFVKAFRALPKFKGDSAFYTWLFRITMNLALDRKRQRATRAKALGTDDAPPEEWERTAVSTDPDPETEAAGTERRARIARALESLSEHHRSIIILSDIEGLAYREIADVLGIPIGTVMSRLHHARRRLREALGRGFATLLVTLGLTVLCPALSYAQGPPPPPPGGSAPPPPTVGAPSPPLAGPGVQVCVYALVILASNQPTAPPSGSSGGPPPPGSPSGNPPNPGLTPTPDLKGDDAGAPAPGGGCGQPMRVRLWAPRLQQVFGYSSYEPISAFETLMPLRVSQRFALPGGRELEIEPLDVRGNMVWLSVKVKRAGVAEIATVLSIPPRGPALIGGPPHGAGVLIIALRSRVKP